MNQSGLHIESVEVSGKSFSFLRSSEWCEEVILFFHGFTGSKAYFPYELASDACIISFDRPGVGESSVLEYYAMDDFLAIVFDTLRSRGVKRAKLVGHSAGGYYAQVFAQAYPEMVKSLTLVSSMIPLNCPSTKAIVGGQWRFIIKLSLGLKGPSKLYFKSMARSIINGYEKQLSVNLKTLSEPEQRFMEENSGLIRSAVMNAVANEGLGVCHDAYALCQKRNKVEIPASIPVYVWHGTNDDTTPLSFAEYFESVYSVERSHIIEGAGHMLYLPNWSEIIQEIA